MSFAYLVYRGSACSVSCRTGPPLEGDATFVDLYNHVCVSHTIPDGVELVEVFVGRDPSKYLSDRDACFVKVDLTMKLESCLPLFGAFVVFSLPEDDSMTMEYMAVGEGDSAAFSCLMTPPGGIVPRSGASAPPKKVSPYDSLILTSLGLGPQRRPKLSVEGSARGKELLKAELIEVMAMEELGWNYQSTADDEGRRFVTCLGDILFYLDGLEHRFEALQLQLPRFFLADKFLNIRYDRSGNNLGAKRSHHKKGESRELDEKQLSSFANALGAYSEKPWFKRRSWQQSLFAQAVVCLYQVLGKAAERLKANAEKQRRSRKAIRDRAPIPGLVGGNIEEERVHETSVTVVFPRLNMFFVPSASKPVVCGVIVYYSLATS